MKTRFNVLIASFAITGALALPAAGAQAERFGRDSIYAVPGKTPLATKIVTNADVTRFGRDSVYATQTRVTGKGVEATKVSGAVTFKPGRA